MPQEKTQTDKEILDFLRQPLDSTEAKSQLTQPAQSMQPEVAEDKDILDFLRQPLTDEQVAGLPENLQAAARPKAPDRPIGVAATDLPDIAEGLPYGLGEAVETIARAGDVLDVPGMRMFISAGQKFKNMFPQDTDSVIGTAIRSGIESTVQMFSVGALGALVGSLGGPTGAAYGFASSTAAIYGLAEYSRFMDELAEVGASNGLTTEEIEELQNEMKDRAIVSGIAEGVFEGLSNLMQMKLLKFLGKTSLATGAKTAITESLERFLVGTLEVAAVETPTELATGFVQSKARESAGIPSSFGAKEITDTIGSVAVQSLLTKFIAGRIQGRQRQRKESGTVAAKVGQQTPEQREAATPEERQQNAQTAVKESPWLDAKKPDPEIEANPGTDAKNRIMNDPTEEDVFVSKRFNIEPLRQLAKQLQAVLTAPTYFFRKEGEVTKQGVMKRLPEVGPLRMAFEIDLAERALHHAADAQARAFDAMKVDLSTEEQEAAKGLLDDVLIARNPSWTRERRAAATKRIEDTLTKHPALVKVLDGTNDAPGLIAYFENMRDRYKNMLRQVLRLKVPEGQYKAFEYIIDNEATKTKATDAVKRFVDVESIVREKQRAKNKDFDSLQPNRQKKLIKDEVKKQAKQLQKLVDEHKEIDNWGVEDYITRIELGAYRIYDDQGRTYGFAETHKKAKAEAFKIRSELKEQGREMPKLKVARLSAVRPDPTKASKQTLPGARNIFDVLHHYDYAMQKRLRLEPLVEKYKREKKLYPSLYTALAQKVIDGQLEYVKGNVYSWGDQIVDKLSLAFGGSVGKYSRGTAAARAFMTNVKLGYRLVAATVNRLAGHGNTLIATGLRIKRKAKKALRSGKYEAPDGTVINTANLLHRNMNLLGVDLTIGETGRLTSDVALRKPLGLFASAESSIRKHGFMANYIYMREKFNMQHNEAVTSALFNLTFQNFSYNLAAMPAILRSPGSKLIGQFKSYMIFQIQFLSQLNGKQALRALGVHLALGGPRSIIYTLRSLPVLAAVGLLDDMEEYLLQDKGYVFDFLARGVGGLVGADITAAAAMQLPSEPEDWAGVVLASLYELWRDVGAPLTTAVTAPKEADQPAYISERAIDWLENLPVIYKYLDEVAQSLDGYAVNLDYTGDLQKFLRDNELPEVWIRDSKGNKAYEVNTVWDRALLLSGASPIERTRIKSLMALDFKRTQIRVDNRRRWMRRAVRALNNGENLSAEMKLDAKLYGVDLSTLPTAYTWSQYTPAHRQVLQARLLEKAEKLDFYGLGRKD